MAPTWRSPSTGSRTVDVETRSVDTSRPLTRRIRYSRSRAPSTPARTIRTFPGASCRVIVVWTANGIADTCRIHRNSIETNRTRDAWGRGVWSDGAT